MLLCPCSPAPCIQSVPPKPFPAHSHAPQEPAKPRRRQLAGHDSMSSQGIIHGMAGASVPSTPLTTPRTSFESAATSSGEPGER